jgi:Uma2 family endonuclease
MPARVAYCDYEALPADGRRYELHEGELLVTASPGLPHQRLVGDLFVVLREHVQAHRLGEVFLSPVDCILSDTTVVQPDVIYLEAAQSSLAVTRGVEGAPTLAVEIVSPSTARIDRGATLRLYARHGMRYYWIVDPDAQSIEAYVLVDNVLRLTGRIVGAGRGSLPPFPDLTSDAASLWRVSS